MGTACSNPDKLPENNAEPQLAQGPNLALTPLQIEAQKRIETRKQEALSSKNAEDAARSAFQNSLFDPSSATFLNVRFGREGAVCGKVNAKNRYGAYVGYKDFVIAKGGEPVVSASNDGINSELVGDFAEAFATYCASKSDQALRSAILAPAPAPEWTPPTTQSTEPDRVLDAPASDDDSSDPNPTT